MVSCWSWAWANRISPSKWVWFGSHLAACFVNTSNKLHLFDYQWHVNLLTKGQTRIIKSYQLIAISLEGETLQLSWLFIPSFDISSDLDDETKMQWSDLLKPLLMLSGLWSNISLQSCLDIIIGFPYQLWYSAAILFQVWFRVITRNVEANLVEIYFCHSGFV